MRILSGREAAAAVEQLGLRGANLARLEGRVQKIVSEVRRDGDRALRRYAEQWDGLTSGQLLMVSKGEMKSALRSLATQLRAALGCAAENIRRLCEWQKPSSWTRTHKGISLGQVVQPLGSVGCYVPGGRYPLLSTVLMTVIPAQVAGVKNIAVVSPRPSKEVLGAAAMLGVKRFYRVGGAQAIAALAYGTESVSRVDKIVGPGNAYVTAAKKLVSFDCAIDFLAGPTETVIVSDAGNPAFIAADMVAQAEHDADALSVFITTSHSLAESVRLHVEQMARGNPTAQESLGASGTIFVAASRKQAREWMNRLAPEHITVEEKDLPFVQNAGSIFVGNFSAQAAGDYASGPNHVLPTAGQARFRGGLSVLDFVKIITVQKASAAGLRRLAPAIQCLAAAEGLPAHENSVRMRCQRA
jgi:histidinol dehydrogenase